MLEMSSGREEVGAGRLSVHVVVPFLLLSHCALAPWRGLVEKRNGWGCGSAGDPSDADKEVRKVKEQYPVRCTRLKRFSAMPLSLTSLVLVL